MSLLHPQAHARQFIMSVCLNEQDCANVRQDNNSAGVSENNTVIIIEKLSLYQQISKKTTDAIQFISCAEQSSAQFTTQQN